MPRDAYFTLFVDIHPGKVCPFYSILLTNWEKLPIFGHFYPGRVFYFAVKYSPLTQLSWLVGARCGNYVIGTVQLLMIWNDQCNDGNCVTNFKLCDGE